MSTGDAIRAMGFWSTSLTVAEIPLYQVYLSPLVSPPPNEAKPAL